MKTRIATTMQPFSREQADAIKSNPHFLSMYACLANGMLTSPACFYSANKVKDFLEWLDHNTAG